MTTDRQTNKQQQNKQNDLMCDCNIFSTMITQVLRQTFHHCRRPLDSQFVRFEQSRYTAMG